MTLPTISQQKGLAYAPIPFAVISFLSSCFVIHYIVRRHPKKLQRLYHRLVLAMNFALLPLSFTYAWSTMAIPEGTPNYVGAMGTVNTCTAQGFIRILFGNAVATYYGSLGLQAFLGMKNNFKQENYQWIEKWVHLVAYFLPFVLATIIAATENFNPNGSGCFIAKAPLGCETDTDVPCERGKDADIVIDILALSQVFLYLLVPPSGVLAVYYWIKRQHKKSTKNSIGMSIIRESLRRQMMQSVYRQISVYLFSFWIAYVFTMINSIYHALTGLNMYNLLIFGNCMFAFQGFITAMVYFSIQRMGRPKFEAPLRNHTPQLTVSDIRSNAERKYETGNLQEGAALLESEESFDFNIFDGTPDADSPWAKYIDCSDYSGDEDNEDAPGHLDEDTLQNLHEETQYDLHEHNPDNLEKETPEDLHKDIPGNTNKDSGMWGSNKPS